MSSRTLFLLFALLFSPVLWGKVSATNHSIEFTKDPNALREGAYVGFIAMDNKESKIPVVLSIIKVGKQDDGKVISLGILRANFGGFQSHEYVAQKYTIFHHKEFMLNARFDDSGPDTSLLDGEIGTDGSYIQGRITTLFGGPIDGKAKLLYYEDPDTIQDRVNLLFPDRYTIPPVTGEYIGTCRNKPIIIQLEAFRNYSGTQPMVTPFFGHLIYGRVGRRPNRHRVSLGLEDNADYVLDRSLDNVAYNYYTQSISIPGFSNRCTLLKDSLRCSEDCELKTFRGGAMIAQRMVFPFCTVSPFESPLESSDEPRLSYPYDKEEVSGNYYGVVFNEHKNTYERLHLEVTLNRVIDGAFAGRSFVSVVGNVIIGDGLIDESQFIPFAYKPTLLPEEPLNQFLIRGESDPLIRITQWTPKQMKGIWYSNSFGRVGEFHVRKYDEPYHPRIAHAAKDLNGRYEFRRGIRFQYEFLDLVVYPDTHLTVEPSFPFRIGGLWEIRKFPPLAEEWTQIYRIPIHQGSYDPFTQTLALRFPNLQVMLGTLTEDGFFGYISQEFANGREIIAQLGLSMNKIRPIGPEIP